jgi:hypothetical protein
MIQYALDRTEGGYCLHDVPGTDPQKISDFLRPDWRPSILSIQGALVKLVGLILFSKRIAEQAALRE